MNSGHLESRGQSHSRVITNRDGRCEEKGASLSFPGGGLRSLSGKKEGEAREERLREPGAEWGPGVQS